MSRTIMLIPTETNVGLTSVILGVIRAIEHKNIRLRFFKPITQSCNSSDLSDQIAIVKPLRISYVESMISSNQKDLLMEEIIGNYYMYLKKDTEITLVEGLVSTRNHQFAQSLNYEIASILNAEVVFVMSQGTIATDSIFLDSNLGIKRRVEIILSSLEGVKNINITGVIINKMNAPVDEQGYTCSDLSELFDSSCLNNSSYNKEVAGVKLVKFSGNNPLPVLGAIPWNFDLITTRAIDIARHLNAIMINKGEINTRRVKSIISCTLSIPHMLECFREGSLLVISPDYLNLLVTACLEAINGTKIGAVLLTDGYKMDICINKLCERAFATGLPVFMVNTNIWQTFLKLKKINPEVPIDDHERIKKTQEYIASYIDEGWIESLISRPLKQIYRLSPPAFRHRLTKLAREAHKRIILPEGNEPRTVRAASACAKQGIATCVLLGDPDEINQVAISQGIKLDDSIEIINPKLIRENYVNRLIELRKNKGITKDTAREEIKDNVVLGTLMLEQEKVDGLVSGAVHTTANTIRPSLQLIKTAPGSSLVSSVFFMLLPEQVYVYGDCAINPDPNFQQLAEIAIQSADSAVKFGINPYVAMLSYSTGNSGTGNSVEKVRKATQLVKEKRPDLIIDGPLQYDAAVATDVAKFKAPNSPVAGRATVFIFPDLNTGNITYKAVQRSAGLISIGPMLQGMRKPVNDLSRGALVNDIIYTIALTAVQATHDNQLLIS